MIRGGLHPPRSSEGWTPQKPSTQRLPLPPLKPVTARYSSSPGLPHELPAARKSGFVPQHHRAIAIQRIYPPMIPAWWPAFSPALKINVREKVQLLP
jgi:hypothetical protein